MERSVSSTNTNIVNEHIVEIVKLYFEGVPVKEAIKEVKKMKKLKRELDKLIIKNNFNLTNPEVVKLSQKLDKEVVKEQRKRLLCKAT
ncbi:aspartyl-phosphate phosphatase Spo0E family protein [Clostridium lacusfryxellense]|uniref:aspartyl-phosphate phosphatase Spo0E family protein n=1 Tax=Clostridium lacusfryxellense TaxID=205328 RepID=UPI001C0DEE35|nr:aspartyl-phosphate phosphatase Spo0E family protein [Clostridium lacusfryxellense]MBU3111962.1 aspartyl-phosphate phosphatase Spo0E family protein [Clostridium lacusfryxellense]